MNKNSTGGSSSKACAPGTKFQDNTCFTLTALKKIASAYNRDRAKNSRDYIDTRVPKKQLWQTIRKKLSNSCNNEWCWIDMDFIKRISDRNILDTFKYKRPIDQYQWLSTDDLNRAMKQYEHKYPNFAFFGPVPIDFSEIQTELENMNIKGLYQRGTTKIGIIFNLDPHYQSGSHWVCMFIDLDKAIIGYFDSYGLCPAPKQIRSLMDKITKSGTSIGKRFKKKCNEYRHQYANSECGVYCMYFIIESLKGRTFEDISSSLVYDEEMNLKRNLYCAPNTK
jgi:hypothetical protein